jgi:hypothetical protein
MWQALYSLTKQNPWNHKVKMLNSNSFASVKQGNENIFFDRKLLLLQKKEVNFFNKKEVLKDSDFLQTIYYHWVFHFPKKNHFL